MIGIAAIIGIMYVRIMWHIRPNLLRATIFYAVVLLMVLPLGSPLVIAGVLSNALVILANKGHMPVRGLRINAGAWIPATGARWPLLGDILLIPLIKARISVGDCLLFFGLIMYFVL